MIINNAKHLTGNKVGTIEDSCCHASKMFYSILMHRVVSNANAT